MATAGESIETVIAFAGRRTDADDADPVRFPLQNVHALQDVLTVLLRRERAVAVVASGACGSDLTALQVAEELGLRFRIVLPFSPARFRECSVVDRPHPEYWGPLFDHLVAAARARGELVELDLKDNHRAPYAAANRAIIAEATALASGDPPRRRLAVIALDEIPRETTDATREFAKLAKDGGFDLVQISTLEPRLPGGE